MHLLPEYTFANETKHAVPINKRDVTNLHWPKGNSHEQVCHVVESETTQRRKHANRWKENDHNERQFKDESCRRTQLIKNRVPIDPKDWSATTQFQPLVVHHYFRVIAEGPFNA